MWIRQLAAAGDLIVPILFGLISIGAAIMNSINAKKEAPRKPAGRPRDQQVRKEIEEFLQQQGGGRKARPVEVGPDDIEVVEEAPRRRPSPVVKPSKSSKSTQRPTPTVKAKPAPTQPKPRESAPPTQVTKRGDRPLVSQDFGTGLREHLNTAMAERVAAQVQRDLPHLATSVDQKVREDLGTFSVSGKTDPVRSGSSSLISMLQNPKTARQAVLMSEIMGRPKALRK